MRKHEIFGFLLLAAGVAAVFLWARVRVDRSPSIDASGLIVRGAASDGPSHAVTPVMSDSSRGMVGRPAPRFVREATDGRTYDAASLLRRGPLMLTFTKVGCPCSEAAQPFFNQLARAYPGATALGVVNAEAGPARLWMRRIGASYPQLLDPDLKLARDLAVENSAYVVVLGADGRIVEHWPGLSREMLGRLSLRLAGLTNAPEHTLDFGEAPEELYSGCPYEF